MASETTVVLTPDPTTPTIVGRDRTGLGWRVLDPGALLLRCGGCGGVIVYRGYVSADGREKRCGGCVTVVNANGADDER